MTVPDRISDVTLACADANPILQEVATRLDRAPNILEEGNDPPANMFFVVGGSTTSPITTIYSTNVGDASNLGTNVFSTNYNSAAAPATNVFTTNVGSAAAPSTNIFTTNLGSTSTHVSNGWFTTINATGDRVTNAYITNGFLTNLGSTSDETLQAWITTLNSEANPVTTAYIETLDVNTLAGDYCTNIRDNSDYSSSLTGTSVIAVEGASSGGGYAPLNSSGLKDAIGIGTGDTPQFTGLEVGHASDTTLARSGAGDVSVEGNVVYRAGGTDVPVTDGGTGGSTAGDARTNLGLAIGNDVQAYDADLAAIAGLTSAADRLPYFDGSESADLATFTATGRSILDDASVSAVLTTIGATPRGYIDGFLMSNDTDADHDISFAAGSCRDSTNVRWFHSTSAIVKRIDATWASGTGNGGLFSGTVANNTWYHCFAILLDSDDLTVDFGFDTSVSAANIPTGYTYYRRLGSVKTDGSANILAFLQTGDYFAWDAPVSEVLGGTTPTSATDITLGGVPTGLKFRPYMWLNFATTGGILSLWDKDQPDLDPATVANRWRQSEGGTTFGEGPTSFGPHTDTSAKIRIRSTVSVTYSVNTHGYTDYRGQNA